MLAGEIAFIETMIGANYDSLYNKSGSFLLDL